MHAYIMKIVLTCHVSLYIQVDVAARFELVVSYLSQLLPIIPSDVLYLLERDIVPSFHRFMLLCCEDCM